MSQQNVLDQLRQLTAHPHITLTHRGDGAILLALHIVKCASPKKTILIPYEAGWLSYQTLPKLLGFEIVEVKTDNGLIDLNDLKTKLTKSSSNNVAAFLIQSLGGYFVQQPMEDIIQICKENNCLVIEDISGSLGFLPRYDSDIKLCSFGKDKLINLGMGGCLSCKEDFLTKFAEQLAPTLRLVQPLFDTALLLPKLASLKSRVAFLSAKAQKIKSDLAHLPLLHQESPAINVVIAFQHDAEKQEIIAYCVQHSYEYTVCPRYIRVRVPAISIEIKRLQN